ncbi:putative endo-beta-1,4-glucanase D [Psilocybe cubensis]|uniref:Endo-beta-1,4-glucanase D n=2 Tax=Psilocybe cubensis TaxID=181762 RepID=A0ACB8GLD0_PSICU|nr:putative endo-beta-1,4-glucanase D [Psilocybe cubensis]KAH9475835.1 putative endo-beta-1,4-glucanase D [Psilocybe cubensis]
MQLSKLALLASFVGAAVAHTRIWGVWVNDVDQGDGVGVYVRSPPTNDPVKDLTSSAMTCNVNNNPVPQTVPVKAGDKLTFEWFHNTRGDDIIASSHKGPILVYIAPTDTNGAPGAVWTKLYEFGISNNLWAVDDLLAAKGKHNIIVPNIPAGNYLLRAEIIALHEANVAYTDNPVRGAQLYMNCVQIQVTSSGNLTLPAGTSFPGSYTSDTPGIVWNLYSTTVNQNTYPIPGPEVWSGAAGGSIAA